MSLLLRLFKTTASLGMAAILCASHLSFANSVVFEADFTPPHWLEQFGPPPWTEGLDRTKQVFDPLKKKTVLEVKYPKGHVGNEFTGAQWKAYLPKSYPTLRLEYWVRFPKNFNFVKGGKLPGLVGGHRKGHPDSTITGGHDATGTNGWSARIMWRKRGEIVQYVYHMNKPGKWGDDLKWIKKGKPARFIPGKWHKVSTEITLNAPTQKNGRIRSWLDQDLVLDAPHLRFRTTNQIGIDALYFSTFFGGEDKTWAPKKDEVIWFDDFRVFRVP